MKVQVLVSALEQNPKELADGMKLGSDAIIINQCDHYAIEEWQKDGRTIKVISMAERGVGLSRNTAMMRAEGDICLFSDQDIVYADGYEEKIIKEFEANPKADMLVFNIEIEESRRTFYNTKRKRVRFYNSGRYGAVSFAIKREALLTSGVTFSLLFGGGARYCNGEDSLFIREFIKKGYRVYTAPVTIGYEKPTESTWFSGYHEKFFFDRGALYHYLYGGMAQAFALRFLLAHREKMCVQLSLKEAFIQMKAGISEAKKGKR